MRSWPGEIVYDNAGNVVTDNAGATVYNAYPGLPRPKYGGNIEDRNGLNSAEEVNNPVRLRTFTEKEISFDILITPDQWQALKAFYEELNGGLAPFLAEWLAEMGFTFHRLRFLSPPQVQSVDSKWFKASLKLEILAGVETDSGGDPLIWPPADELTPADKWG
jgi:hypothetical protein